MLYLKTNNINRQKIFFATILIITNIMFASEQTSLTEEDRSELEYNSAFIKYPSIKILETQPKKIRYGNCHNYAISKALGLTGQIPDYFPQIGQSDWHTKLKFTKKYCKEVTIPQKGDLVTYYADKFSLQEILHTGLVYDNDIVEDKWGATTYIFTHPTFHLPAAYGNYVKYHRIIKPINAIIAEIKATTSHEDYKQESVYWNNKLIHYAEQSSNEKMWQAWQRIMCLHVEASNANGQSLIMIGAKNNNSELVQLAIEHKANINKKDNNGKTALDLAIESNHTEIIALLKK